MALLASSISVARAQQPTAPCPITIEVDAALDASWQRAGATLSEELAALPPGECTASRLRLLRAQDGEVVLRAESGDGRAAERTLRAPSEVPAIAAGVLASIPREAPAAVAPPPTPEEPPPIPAVRAPRRLAPSTHPRARREPEPRGFLLGIAAGARFAEPTHVAMADLELRADVFFGYVFLLGSARFAPFGARVEDPLPHFAYDEIALGVGVGRRFAFGSGFVDLSTMPTLTLADEEALITGEGKDPANVAYLRWNVGARWLFVHLDGWMLGTALDADLAPAALDEPIAIAPLLPPIPTWSIGLHFVACGALQ